MRFARSFAVVVVLGSLAACDRHRTRSHPPIDSAAENKLDRDADASRASPCADFYSYACADWIEQTDIPDDEGMWTRSFQEIGKKNDEALRDILEQDAFQPSVDQPESQALGDFYAACLDETAIDARGDGELRALLDSIDTSDAEHAAVTIAHLHLLGVPSLFVLEPEADLADSRNTNAVIRQPPLPLSDDMYYGSADLPSLDSYNTHLWRMFAFGGDRDAMNDARNTLALERELAGAFEPRAVFHDPSGAPTIFDASQLLKIAPNFPWKTYFSALGIEAPTTAHVATPHYLASLSDIFAREMKTPYGRNSLRVLLRWELVHSFVLASSSVLNQEEFDFESTETGAPKMAPRWKRCVRATESVMGDALVIPFVQKNISDDAVARARITARSIQGAMQNEIEALSWMDDPTRAIAREKIAHLEIEIGKNPASPKPLEFKPNRTSFFFDFTRARELVARRNLARIGKPTDDTPRMSAAAANAYFDSRKNALVVLPGILAPPIFNSESIAASDATLGMILGHETTHALDGRFDASGNLTHWWSDQTLDAYRIRSACVQTNLDHAMASAQMHFHGAQAIDERMADGGGLRVAYRALEHDAPATGAEMKTRDQAFFTGFAQLWCAKFRPEALRHYAGTNAHPPPQQRVNLALSEMSEFANAFSCTPGDVMAQLPRDRCDAW